MQSSLDKLEKFVAELEILHTKLALQQTQTNLSDIVDHFETLDSDSDDSDTDSDVSFTEEEREHIESEEHYAFLKRYSLKPTIEMPFIPRK
jgi:hemerythrin-like domain-containing protein